MTTRPGDSRPNEAVDECAAGESGERGGDGLSRRRFLRLGVVGGLAGGVAGGACGATPPTADRDRNANVLNAIRQDPAFQAVREFAERLIAHGRDRYGPVQGPLFVTQLNAATVLGYAARRHGRSELAPPPRDFVGGMRG